MLVSEALALIQGHGGFDPSVAQTSDTQQRAWLSAMVQEAVAESKWLRQVRQLGPTVAGTADYTVDPDVLQVRAMRVGGGRPLARTTLEDLWQVEGGASYRFVGTGGAFAPSWEEEAAQDVDDVPKNVRLFPAPSTGGLELEAICAVGHKAITGATSGTYRLQVPDDLARAICVDGPIAMGIQLVHNRADLAGPFLARYADGKAKLKARANSLVGGGVRYARIRGR